MKKSTVLIIAFALLCAVLAVAIIAMSRDARAPSSSQVGSQTPVEEQGRIQEPDESERQSLNSANNQQSTIVYNDDGFAPDEITIHAGKEITITNNAQVSLDFASDDHPAHRNNSELNLGVIPSGQSKTLTISSAGTWGFHNHFNDRHTGRIIVE